MADAELPQDPESGKVAPAREKDPQEVATQWLASIKEAAKVYDKFYKRGDRITKRYKNERESEQTSLSGTKFNIFWSNVQTLAPATYSRRPKVEVFRRFRDSDPVARLASQVLQRALQYEVDCGPDLHGTIKACVLDRLLPGQGCAWVRYEPAFETEDVEVPDPENPLATKTEPTEKLTDEKTPVDYVFWKDFLLSPARTHGDVRWVARRLMFSRPALEKRFTESCKSFGGDVTKIPCNYDPAKADLESGKTNKEEGDATLSRALIWEIWDKESKQLIWVCDGYDYPLDLKDDPARLEEFFPCPMPLSGTMTNDSIVPTADFVLYSDQLKELDAISTRIQMLTSALRVIGVYDASQTALQGLLQGGYENRMIPVNAWAAFAEKGGLKGVMEFLPLEQVFAVLDGLQRSREALKQVIYEITGMADIVRGVTIASETRGAQEIKAKFANLRLSSRQQQVAEFVTAILRIKAEWMCEMYSPETLVRISSIEQIPEVQKDLEKVAQQQAAQAAQMQQMMAQMQAPPQMPPQAGPVGPGQPVAPPEAVPPEAMPPQAPPQPAAPPEPPPPVTDPMQSPLVQQALALLKNERVRKYRIEIASDSMIELDEVDERERRNEFMSATSNFMLAMKNVSENTPEMVPVALEMLKFVVRGFSVGRSLEASIEEASDQILKRMANPQPPPPDPNLVLKKEIEGMKIQSENARTALQEDTKKDLGELQAAVKLITDNMAGQEARLAQQLGQVHEGGLQRDKLAAAASQQEAGHQQSMEEGAQTAAAGDNQTATLAAEIKALIEQIGKPRIRKGVYDDEGELLHVRDEIEQ